MRLLFLRPGRARMALAMGLPGVAFACAVNLLCSSFAWAPSPSAGRRQCCAGVLACRAIALYSVTGKLALGAEANRYSTAIECTQLRSTTSQLGYLRLLHIYVCNQQRDLACMLRGPIAVCVEGRASPRALGTQERTSRAYMRHLSHRLRVQNGSDCCLHLL